MQAILPEALPLPATLKGVTTYGQRNGLLFMLKEPRVKTVSYRTLGFPGYGMANASNFTRGFTPTSNPERGNNIWATKLAFIYVKRARLKKQCHVVPYFGSKSTEWPMQAISREALPLPATPKGVTTLWETQLAFSCVKMTQAKNSVTLYILGFP